MRQNAQQLMTVEQLYELPDNDSHYELVQGRLVAEPPTGYRHGRITTRIVKLLSSFVDEHRLGDVLTCDPGFVLHRGPDTVRAPDVAFVTTRAAATVEDERRFFGGAPDLAVEVLSPGDRPAQVHAKVADYLAAGTTIVWIVDAEAENVSCYRELLAPQVKAGADSLEAEDLLPGFSIAVAEIFAR